MIFTPLALSIKVMLHHWKERDSIDWAAAFRYYATQQVQRYGRR